MEQIDPARNWTEDSELENGNYCNTCCVCNHAFIGYKRRVVCKKCQTAADAAWAKLSPEERAAAEQERVAEVVAWQRTAEAKQANAALPAPRKRRGDRIGLLASIALAAAIGAPAGGFNPTSFRAEEFAPPKSTSEGLEKLAAAKERRRRKEENRLRQSEAARKGMGQ